MDERCLFFVKQRTAYEMRISDWSSDVCSSDLDHPDAFDAALGRRGLEPRAADLIALDERHRAVITEVQAGQARRNEASKAIGAAKAQKDEATAQALRSEEHTSELQSLMRNSYAVFCLKKKKRPNTLNDNTQSN